MALLAAFHPHQDDDYKAAGATIVDKATSFKADIVLKVKPPSLQEADLLKERARYTHAHTAWPGCRVVMHMQSGCLVHVGARVSQVCQVMLLLIDCYAAAGAERAAAG